jgi:hypothetical protein
MLEQQQGSTLVIACGAIAHELVELSKANGWQHLDIQCLPAHWHNTPEKIAPGVRAKIEQHKHHYQQIFVAYADCGTGGQLDSVLQEHNIERLPGSHCYSFFAGHSVFEAIADDEPGTFYLTDYLARHFQRLVMDGLGITQHPQLRDQYFAHYKRLVYLRQETQSERRASLARDAQSAAAALELPLEIIDTGLAPLSHALMPVHINTAES